MNCLMLIKSTSASGLLTSHALFVPSSGRKLNSLQFCHFHPLFHDQICRLFLLGLQKYGKGDWRNISRNFVKSKTATQVASHAQKYFIRQQLSEGGKDKRRPSIHDITTVDLAEITAASPKSPPSDQPTILPKSNFTPKIVQEWSHYNDRAFMFMASPFEIASHGNHFHVL